MTTLREMPLRDKVLAALTSSYNHIDKLEAIANMLSDTGAPAYMRVAADLRGKWVDTPLDTTA